MKNGTAQAIHAALRENRSRWWHALFAVVDVWDALSSDRPYRPAWKRDEVIKHIQEESGTHFDPAVTKVFLDLIASRVIDTASF